MSDIHPEAKKINLDQYANGEGVFLKNEAKYDDGKLKKIEGLEKKPLERLVENSINTGGQVLVFVNTRRSTVSVANKLTKIIENKLSDKEKKNLEKTIAKIKKELPEKTSVDEQLFYCIKNESTWF